MTTHEAQAALQAQQAHQIVAAFASRRGDRAWRLDRVRVAARLHQLIDKPELVRQGRLNLCGPATAWALWLRHDPAGAVGFAEQLYESGAAQWGTIAVMAPRALLGHVYQADMWRCPEAEWMVMSALRDTANRAVRYGRPGTLLEPVAGITPPGDLRRWLLATGRFSAVRDETNLVLGKGIAHACRLDVSDGGEVVLLVAQRMLRERFRPLRDSIAGVFPDHWILLRTPIRPAGEGTIELRYWTWGAEHRRQLPAARFRRGYFGALLAAPAVPHPGVPPPAVLPPADAPE